MGGTLLSGTVLRKDASSRFLTATGSLRGMTSKWKWTGDAPDLAVDKRRPPCDHCRERNNQRPFRGPGLPPGPLSFLGDSDTGREACSGSDGGRQRPTGVRAEEVPPPDHQGRAVPGHEAEALLREPRRSAAAEG